MSHSYRKNPVIARASASEKQAKRQNNRRLRKQCKHCLSTDPEDCVLPTMREISDEWDMPKDGKHRFDPRTARGTEDMRK